MDEESKELYLCKNEEKAIQKINEIINRINDIIKGMVDDEQKIKEKIILE